MWRWARLYVCEERGGGGEEEEEQERPQQEEEEPSAAHRSRPGGRARYAAIAVARAADLGGSGIGLRRRRRRQGGFASARPAARGDARGDGGWGRARDAINWGRWGGLASLCWLTSEGKRKGKGRC